MNSDANALIGILAIFVFVAFTLWALITSGKRKPNNEQAIESQPSRTLSAAEASINSSTAERGPTTIVAMPPKDLNEETTIVSAKERVIFLCYRRDDTQDAAGRLRDRLAVAYGDERIFMDIDSVPLGLDFVDHVAERIGRCSAVIVMIGRQWLTVQDKRGRRRLELDTDLVRAEVASALQQKIPVIPVLVQDAEIPSSDDLPDNIRPLTRRNGIELSATRWKTDVERLIKELDRVMKPSGGS